MKILWSGDPHGRMNTLDTFQKYLIWMQGIQIDPKTRPDLVVIAGDLFHTHALIRSEILNEWLSYLRDITVPHVLVKGNHDETAPGSGVHALTAFEGMPNVTVVGNQSLHLLNTGIAFIPYVHTSETFQGLVTQLKSGGVKPEETILFTHQTWDGAKYDNGMYAPDGFPMHLVKDFKQVICGHIHKEQKFGNVWYPGSPYAQGFIDANENKALWLIDITSFSSTRIPTPLPRYITVGLLAENFLSYFEEKQSRGERRHHYKVLIKDSRAAIRALQDSYEYKMIRKSFKITLCPEYTEVMDVAAKISDSISPEKMMEKYVYEVMNTKLNRTELFNMANQIMSGK